MNKTEKRCPICGIGELSKKIIKETFNYKGQSIEIDDYVIWECDECGEAIVDNETLKRTDKILIDFKRRVDNL